MDKAVDEAYETRRFRSPIRSIKIHIQSYTYSYYAEKYRSTVKSILDILSCVDFKRFIPSYPIAVPFNRAQVGAESSGRVKSESDSGRTLTPLRIPKTVAIDPNLKRDEA